jgi:SMC interacting uncharacterized protein involved in chromosome segregation
MISNPKTPKSILKQPSANTVNPNVSNLSFHRQSNVYHSSGILNKSMEKCQTPPPPQAPTALVSTVITAANLNNHNNNNNSNSDNDNYDINNNNNNMKKKKNKNKNNKSSNDTSANDVAELSKYLISFLSQRGYTHEINAKRLKLPTALEFVQVLEFLVSQLDNKLHIKLLTPNQLRKEKEASERENNNRRKTTASFRKTTTLLNTVKDERTSVNGFDEQMFFDLLVLLKHPAPLPVKFFEKSAFSLSGWPKMISIVVWFVEILRYYAYKDEKLRNGLQNSNEGIFFTYLYQTYIYWLNGNENGMQKIVDEWQRDFILKNQALNTEKDEIAAENNRVKTKIDSIISRLQKRRELEDQKNEFMADTVKFERNIQGLTDSKVKLEEVIAINELELKSLRSELDRLRIERESLKQQIDQQVLKPQDVLRMNKTRASLEEEMKKISDERDVCNNKLFSCENECRNSIDKMMKSIQEYNQLSMILPVSIEEEGDENNRTTMCDENNGEHSAINNADVWDEDGDTILLMRGKGKSSHGNSFDLFVTQVYLQDIIPTADHIENSQQQQLTNNNVSSNPIVYQTNIDLFEVESRIRRMKDKLLYSVRKIQDQCNESDERYASIDDWCERQEEKNRELERQYEKEKLRLANAKEDMEKESHRIFIEIGLVEEELKTVKNVQRSLAFELAESQRRLENLRREQQQAQTQFETDLAKMNSLLVKVAESVTEHKSHIQMTLELVRQRGEAAIVDISQE